nr:T9SS type A sorting domain-containing protein [uncultured Psychroserpens sp.]
MKKNYALYCILLTSIVSFGQIISTETFSYDDGPLLGNGTWAHHSGPEGNLLVVSGQAAVSHALNEDMNLPFESVSGNIYYAFDMTVQDPGTPITGTDNEYFAHFKDNGAGFFARVDLSAPTNGGDYVIGISTTSTEADVTWPTDLTYGTTYRVTVRFDQDEIIAELWLDASTETDASIISDDEAGSDAGIASFALRQSDSADDETILVDNLKIAQSFNGTSLSTEEFTTSHFKVFPNPSSTDFVNIISASNHIIYVNVYDILGKEVINETLTNNRLNVSALHTGVYILKISQNNASVTKKLVVK